MSEEIKKLGPEGVTVLWQKVFELVKLLTGDVDTSKGTLQEQINEIITGGTSGIVKELSLEEYEALSEEEKNNGTLYPVPDAIVVGEDAIELDVINRITEVSYTDDESVRQTIQLADKESVEACAKGEGIEFSVVDGILCVTYDDGIEETETEEGSEE